MPVLSRVDRPGLHVLAVAIALVIVIGSLLPARGEELLGPPLVGVDKLIHFVGYAMFAGVLAAARNASTRRTAVVVFAIAFTLGLSLEFVQWTLPTRVFSLQDGVANAIGAIAGVTGWLRFRRL